jgi:dynein heavy chain 1
VQAEKNSKLEVRNWPADARIRTGGDDVHLSCKGPSHPPVLFALTIFHWQLTQFPDTTLEKPFALIEQKVQQLTDYVAKWLQFQSLWDLEAEYVFNRLGDSLSHWQQLLTEIKKARSTFDTSDTSKSFGVCVIDYEQVQARVNAKYDAWQKDILSRFGVKLGNAMKEMHAQILKARNELEHHSIEGLMGGGGGRRFS